MEAAAKPTGLLSVRLPNLGRAFHQRQFPGVLRPTGITIGKNPDTGQFYTHALKEYPTQLCYAMAECLLDAIALQRGSSATSTPSATDVPAAVQTWVDELAEISRVVRLDAPIRPDNQGS